MQEVTHAFQEVVDHNEGRGLCERPWAALITHTQTHTDTLSKYLTNYSKVCVAPSVETLGTTISLTHHPRWWRRDGGAGRHSGGLTSGHMVVYTHTHTHVYKACLVVIFISVTNTETNSTASGVRNDPNDDSMVIFSGVCELMRVPM